MQWIFLYFHTNCSTVIHIYIHIQRCSPGDNCKMCVERLITSIKFNNRIHLTVGHIKAERKREEESGGRRANIQTQKTYKLKCLCGEVKTMQIRCNLSKETKYGKKKKTRKFLQFDHTKVSSNYSTACQTLSLQFIVYRVFELACGLLPTPKTS